MGADLTGILLLILAVSALILVLDRLLLLPKRSAAPSSSSADGSARTITEPALVAFARTLLPVLLIVVVFRAFVFEPFRIPSASMMPGLVDGDFILVSKFSYGLRLPVLGTKFLSTGEPQRGDVVVFRSTSGPSINLIKRLVGRPGDHVVVRDNRIWINGTLIAVKPDGRYDGDFGFHGAELEREQIGRSDHQIMLAPFMRTTDYDAVVPAGHYFFMGDNRNDSEDSRFPDVGFVPEDHLVGHALRIWMNWKIPGWPQLRRVGLPIR